MMKGTRNVWRAIGFLAIVGTVGFVAMAGDLKGRFTAATDERPFEFDAAITTNTIHAQLQPKQSGIDDFIRIEGGKFRMGSPAGTTNNHNNERPLKEVTLSTFYMDKYMVTQEDYETVMGNNPSYHNADPVNGEVQGKRPVERVSWYDALVYANKLSDAKGLTPAYELPDEWPNPVSWSTDTADWGTVPTNGDTRWDNVRVVEGSTGYRLPTEAQWEYAARGGNGSPGNFTYSGSNTIGDVAWYYDNSQNRTHEVGKKMANGLGLYDMNGNAWEWVWDWYGTYPGTAQIDPTGAPTGSDRICRGGNWWNSAMNNRVISRFIYGPHIRDGSLGFRLARPAQ